MANIRVALSKNRGEIELPANPSHIPKILVRNLGMIPANELKKLCDAWKIIRKGKSKAADLQDLIASHFASAEIDDSDSDSDLDPEEKLDPALARPLQPPCSSDLIAARREDVLQAYNSAIATNRRLFLEGDDKATSEYIFPNQMEDASCIADKFYKGKRRVISIQKKTKVGADGLMIEIAKLLTTHIDDAFVINPANVRIITGMSNAGWEKDMIEKAPNCFKNKIFHHGKLSRSDLTNLQNGLLIIDEIDTGDKEYQVLHTTLKEAGVLDVKHMESHNNRFVFISATMIKELYDLYHWGEFHELYTMSIPSSYVGHTDFLEKKIVKEFYSLHTSESAEKWVQEDIIDHYHNDYRVHLVRVNAKIAEVVQNACIRKGVSFRNHTSTDRLSEDEIKELFKENLTQHIVLGVKGFFRRANLIPNRWKLRIGATHELYTKKVDNNVQIQGLTGRMTGYWRDVIEAGHITGPHRTSIKAIEEYETTYADPFGNNSYQTAGFKKRKGRVSADPTMLSAKHVANLQMLDMPLANAGEFEKSYEIFDTQAENEAFAKKFGQTRTSRYAVNEDGFKMCTITTLKVQSLDDIINIATNSKEGSNMNKGLSSLKVGEYAHRRYVCYRNTDDPTTECFVTIWVKRLLEPSA